MPARRERSAGVLIYRVRESSSEQPEFLLLDYGRHWDFPKGHLNSDEDDLTAALRELREETGLDADDVQIVPDFQREIVYFFRNHKKGLVRKEVTFFLAKTDRERIKLSHEHAGYEFLPLDAAIERTTFKSSKEVLRAAAEAIGK